MKIRSCFVTNSSTACYILTAPKRDIPIKITVEVDVRELQCCSILESVEDLVDRCSEVPEETLKLLKREVKRGKKIILLRTSNSEGTLERELTENCLTQKDVVSKGVKIVYARPLE